MLYSRLFVKTQRNVPRDVQSPSYRLLLQGGYVRPVSQGLFTFTPLGMLVVRRIMRILDEEMRALGGQEILVPLVNPREMWIESGRDELLGNDMVRFQDRSGRRLVLAPTHEEAVVELVRHDLRSYRELPLFLYQFQTKFRDEARTRCGTVRAREFIMKDGYSFHRTFADLNIFFPKVFAAYRRLFERCRLPVIAAEAGVGYMGGDRSYEFLMPCECGDDTLVRCDRCDYAANAEVAIGIKKSYSAPLAPLQSVPASDHRSVRALANALGYDRTGMMKSMLYRTATPNRFVMAVVRGDLEVSTEKLSRVAGTGVQGLAKGDELAAMGLSGHWLSPLNLPEAARSRIQIVVDDSTADSNNLVAGANNEERAWENVNIGRDLSVDAVADIVTINAGAACRHCADGRLYAQRAMELGNIFRLGDYYTRRLGFRVRTESGEETYPHMGSYGIGVGRLLAAIVDANRDGNGIIWPAAVAPFQIFLMSIGTAPSVRELAEEIHEEFGEAVLHDDRHESISTKLKDADLLGIPVRLVITRDSVTDGVIELSLRDRDAATRVQRGELAQRITALLEEYQSV